MQTKEPSKSILIVALVLGVLWSVVFIVALLPALPNNPVALSYNLKTPKVIRTTLPEGWKFYTRDPREGRYHLYHRPDGRWVSASIGPNARPSNALGINRKGRAQGVEAGILIISVPSEEWIPCSEEISTCLDSISFADTLENISPRPTLCGVVGFAKQEIVPWAWRHSTDQLTLPSHITKVNVLC